MAIQINITKKENNAIFYNKEGHKETFLNYLCNINVANIGCIRCEMLKQALHFAHLHYICTVKLCEDRLRSLQMNKFYSLAGTIFGDNIQTYSQ